MKQEYRKKLEEINNECDLESKILKMKELFEKTDFLKEHDMLDVIDYADKSDNLLERFLRYRDDEDVYKGVDVDVSLGAITVYCMMFDYLQIVEVKKQNLRPFYFVSNESYFEMHLDTDDANAFLLKNNDEVEIIL